MNNNTEIEEYMSRLNFKKKAFGGYDEEDVLLKMKQLNDLYQRRVEYLEKQLADTEQRAAEKQRQTQSEKREEEGHKITYDSQVSALNSLLLSIESSKDEILQQTKISAQKEAEKIRRDMIMLRRQKKSLEADIDGTMHLVTSALQEIIDKADHLQKQTAGQE